MKFGNFNLGKEVLVIAEVGNNHEGSYTLAEELVGLAAESGAGAVKFQTFITDHYVSSADPARRERLKKFELGFDKFEKLANYAKKAGILFFSTPFDIESARFLNSIVPFFKIASGDNTFYPLIEEVAGFGKPMIISTGLADLPTIRKAKSVVEGVWSKKNVNPGLAVLHCVTAYPVPEDQVALGDIPYLQRELGCTVGYSDHAMGIDCAAYSVCFGARIVEKHFTKDKNYSDFRDHALSADPADLKALVQRIRAIEKMIGPGVRKLKESEIANAPLVRRSIATSRELPAGAVVKREDLTWLRPGSGIPPGQEDRVVGHKLKTPLKAGEIFSPEQLE